MTRPETEKLAAVERARVVLQRVRDARARPRVVTALDKLLLAADEYILKHKPPLTDEPQ